MSDIDNSEGVISPVSMNTMRKFIDANINEGRALGFDDVFLIRAKQNFLDTTEKMLAAKNRELKTEFQVARELWRKQL